MPFPARPRPLARHMAVFALALTLPGLLFCAVVTHWWVASEQERYAAIVDEVGNRAAEEIERILAGQRVMLQALATSPALDVGDFARFDRQAREVPGFEGIAIILRDRSGQQLVNTRMPPGSALAVRVLESDRVVRETNQPYVSDLFSIQGTGEFFIVVSMPVIRDGRQLYFLNASMRPTLFLDLLQRAGVRAPYFGSLVDRNGVVIARSGEGPSMTGKVLPSFAERIGERGVWTGPNMDGLGSRVAYQRLPGIGWMLSIGIPQISLAAPLQRSLWLLAGMGVLFLFSGLAVSVPVLRRMMAAQRKAADTARSLAESEARHRTLTDALPQIVWLMSGPDGRASFVNAQFRAYFGSIGPLSRDRIDRVHPEDQRVMGRSWRAAYSEGRAFDSECRMRRHDGVYRWHKLVMLPVRNDRAVVEWLGTVLDIDDIVTARRELEKATDLLRLAQEAAGAGVWDWDLKTGAVRLSLASAGLHRISPQTPVTADGMVELSFAQWESLLVAEDLPGAWSAWHAAVESRKTYSAEYRIISGAEGGGTCWLQTFGRIMFDDATGEPVRCVGLTLDVTARREAEAALRLNEARLRISEERLGLALDSGDDGLWDWDLVTGEAWVSDRWYRMLGYEGGGLLPSRRSWEHIIHPDDARRAVDLLKVHLKGLTPLFECEYRLKRKDGSFIWVLTRGKVVSRCETGRAKRVVGTQIDITLREEAEQQIAHMALHDALTDLPNRALFRDRLQEAVALSERQGSRFAVLCLDLDRFKSINDTYGHSAGDALLSSTAERLKQILPDGHTIARLGGDEFVIILGDVDDARSASTAAERLIEAVGQPHDLDGRLAHVGVSIGFAIGPQDGRDADTLFKNADIALYRAKAAGRNTHCFYDAGMGEAVSVRNRLELELRDAFRNGEFVLYYQPVVNLANDAVGGFEALLRWSHPTRGMIPPNDFIPLAEETGLIVPLGAWALQEACREAATWPGDLRIAVNVSAVQFRQAGLEQGVMMALSASGLAPHRLELEITESVLMQDSDAVIACLHRLRALGVHIALDDFGTGYSSLSYLRLFPFNRIKIDRSFIRAIGEPDTAAVVQAIIGLGARLGAAITAEGVETEEQLDRVRREGCGEVQGYYFSKPIPASELGPFLVRPSSAQAA